MPWSSVWGKTSGMKTQGVREVLKSLDSFGEKINADCRKITAETIARVRVEAKALCRYGNEPGEWPGHVRDQIMSQISRDYPQGAVWVERRLFMGRMGGRYGTDNVGLWLEYGTVKMGKKPFLRPAVDNHRNAYEQDLRAATDRRVAAF